MAVKRSTAVALLVLLVVCPGELEARLRSTPWRAVQVHQHTTLQEFVAAAPAGGNSKHHPPALAVVLLGDGGPTACQPVDTPLWGPAAAARVPLPVQHAVSHAVLQLQRPPAAPHQARGCALTIDLLPAASRSGPAYTAWHAASNTLLLREEALRLLASTPLPVVRRAAQAGVAAGRHMMLTGRQAPSQADGVGAMLPGAVAAGLAAAFPAARKPPLWFCMLCPIVLGLAAPLVINAGVGEAADAVCRALDLPDESCSEVFVAALGLGLMLSLLAALPIYRVCHLSECVSANPHNTSGSYRPSARAVV